MEVQLHSGWSLQAGNMAANASVGCSGYIVAAGSASDIVAAWTGYCCEASMAISWSCLSLWHLLEYTMSWSPYNLFRPYHGSTRGSNFYHRRHYSCLDFAMCSHSAEQASLADSLSARSDCTDSIMLVCNSHPYCPVITKPVCHNLAEYSCRATFVKTVISACHSGLCFYFEDWRY